MDFMWSDGSRFDGADRGSIARFTDPPDIDPVSDIEDIPEPGTLALLGVGLLGLIAARRRRAAG